MSKPFLKPHTHLRSAGVEWLNAAAPRVSSKSSFFATSKRKLCKISLWNGKGNTGRENQVEYNVHTPVLQLHWYYMCGARTSKGYWARSMAQIPGYYVSCSRHQQLKGRNEWSLLPRPSYLCFTPHFFFFFVALTLLVNYFFFYLRQSQCVTGDILETLCYAYCTYKFWLPVIFTLQTNRGRHITGVTANCC